MEKLIKNTIIETYCLRHCCQDTPKRAVHAEVGAVSINTKVKSEDTEITDTGRMLASKTPPPLPPLPPSVVSLRLTAKPP